jgi:hypothetical protein
MSLPNYTQAVIKKCSIDNVDISLHVRQLYVSSSIFTPYITAKLSIVDVSMIQDALYEPGLPVSIAYTGGDSSIVREYNLVTMANMGGAKEVNNRAGKTEIIAISRCYFDMQNEHSSYHQNIPTSEVFRKLHNELVPGSNINITKTRGLIADIEPFHLRGIRLGRAINLVRNRMTDEKYKSSAYLYYADQNSDYHCVPAEQLFDTASGPRYTQKVAGISFLKEQDTLAYNIISMKRGSTPSGSGSDDATTYKNLQRQRGGATNEGWDWASGTYTAPSSKSYKLSSTKTPGSPGDNIMTSRGADAAAGTVNHNFMIDSNQKSSADFESDVANKNIISALMMQGSTLINVPLEGGLQSYVGKGCQLDIPSDIGDGDRNKSLYGGQHLVIAQGEYIFQDNNGTMGIAAIQASSGGKQGSLV